MESGSQPSDASEQVSGVEETPVDPMEVFRRQLEDILNMYGSAGSIMEETISSLEKDEENLEDESVKADTEMSSSSSVLLEDLGEEALVLLQTLRTLSSPEEKVETLLRKYTELLKEQMNEQVKMKLLQKRQVLLVEQRDRLQLEHSRGILARSGLEKLCRDLHQHNTTLKEDMLQKCKEDEIKRTEIHSHFHNTVVDIQAQIEQHSSRNNKLSQENIELANKLTSIIQQYEKREESWEKIFKQKDLQQQLSDAKLQEANLRLSEEEEKHKREKEYLLKEAIDKTKKCVTLKEQELQMKKQLVLYSQKFEEFQATLAKSNEIYGIFKQEMEKMTTKMDKLEKEANMWRLRFESCNKALTQMIEERSEKGKEFELFTVKIDKLETLCRALQEERKVLYDKIKEVRLQTASASAPLMDISVEEIPDLEQLTVKEPLGNPVITTDMKNLWKEQERLQKFAASLLGSNAEDKDASDSVEPEPPVPGPVPSKPPTVRFQLDSENQAGKEAIKELQQSESNQQEEEPPKEEPPKEEPPKAESPKEEPPKEKPPKEEPPKKEPPKAESPKEEPPKEKPPKEEPPKEEPPKAESPKEEPPKEEPTKAESPKEEPPKEEPTKAESPKEEPPKEEPTKAESPKEEPPKEEPTKAESPKEEPPKEEPTEAESPKGEPPKAESLKEEPPNVEPLKEEPPKLAPPEGEPLKDQLPKVPNRNVAEVKPIQQNKHTQKSNSVEHKEPEPEVETHTAPAEASQAHTQQEPKLAPGAEAEPQNPEAQNPEAQNPEAQEPKPSAHKAQGKKQNSSKRRGAAKGVKKS